MSPPRVIAQIVALPDGRFDVMAPKEMAPEQLAQLLLSVLSGVVRQIGPSMPAPRLEV